MTKKKYPSRYSPKKQITEAQYIIELICEKNAAQTGRELPIKFWELPEWSAFYRSQLRKCHSLLKKYSSEAIIKGLMDARANKIYSLFAPWLEEIIQKYQHELNKPVIKKEIAEVGGENFKREDYKPRKNLIDKLDL